MKNESRTFPHLGLIGPLLPYRGGISQYMTMLHRSLSQKSDLASISFSRQYPRLLYPGKCDIDCRFEGHKEPGAYYVLDSLNPVTWLKSCRFLVFHRISALVIPWWTVYWAPCFWFIVNFLRKKDIKIIFICHNVIEHESAYWKVMAMKRVLSCGNGFLVHTSDDACRLADFVPKERITVHAHPIYSQFPAASKILTRRARLELLFYGFVRPYKGVDILMEAMHLLKGEDVYLTVAGEWWNSDSKLRKRIEDEGLKRKVEIINRYVTEEETAEYFSRADVVVLPYRSASGTGVIPLAYHYGKPVIATTVGGLPEVVNDGVSGRLVKPEDPNALADAIRGFLHNEPSSMLCGVKKTAENMTWESLTDRILDLSMK